MGVQLGLRAKAHQWIDEYDRLEKAFINATKTRSQHESAANAKARRDHDAHLSAQTLSDPKANQVEVPLGTGVRKLFFPSGFIRKIWTFWTWDRTYFTALPNGAIIMPADRWTTDALYHAVDLYAVAFGGDLALTVFNCTGLLFSFLHMSYQITMVCARGCVILFFSWLKNKEMRRQKETMSYEPV